jgi:hypothetical protein
MIVFQEKFTNPAKEVIFGDWDRRTKNVSTAYYMEDKRLAEEFRAKSSWNFIFHCVRRDGTDVFQFAIRFLRNLFRNGGFKDFIVIDGEELDVYGLIVKFTWTHEVNHFDLELDYKDLWWT